MQSDDYKLEFLPLFYEELNEAAMYITDELQNPDAAERLIIAVKAAIYKRLPNAESFEPVPSKKDRDNKYYRIYIKNFVVYYVVIHADGRKIMEVRRFVYRRRDMQNL